MTEAPYDPEDMTHGNEPAAGSEDDLFGDDLGAWDPDDQLFDLMLRERLGQVPHLPTPPLAFERVLVAGRRQRTRKVWAVGAAAALVVVAGTASTTVVLRGPSSSASALPPAVSVSQGTTQTPGAAAASPSTAPSATSVYAKSLASGPASASAQAFGAAQAPTPTSTSVPQCHSDDLQLTVSVTYGGNNVGEFLIVLRDNSGHPCTISGYAAGLQTETQSQQPQTTKIVQQGQQQVQLVTLAQGQSASTLSEFTFGTTSSTASPAPNCNAPTYYLAVIPPSEQTQLVAPITGGPASLCGADHILDSLPFAPGTTG
jgi:hypothetical protein